MLEAPGCSPVSTPLNPPLVARRSLINSQSIVLKAKRGLQEAICRLEVWSIDDITMITIVNYSLTISIHWIWNVKLGNFNSQDGKRACEGAHGDILSIYISECVNTCKFGQNFKNIQKRSNKISVAKPLLKTAKFFQFGLTKARFPTLHHMSYLSGRIQSPNTWFLRQEVLHKASKWDWWHHWTAPSLLALREQYRCERQRCNFRDW